MEIRHARFDMHELAKRAAESVGSTYSQCARIDKYPDGMFNKAFLFTMQDGKQVVGKVPNPNAGRPHYTTASEVATMDFVRTRLGTPVPKMHAWNSNATGSPVGAEYVIMEKVSGVQLEHVWSELPIEDKFEVVKTISRYQKAWMSVSFPAYGSLYYADDLNPSGKGLLVDEATSNSPFAVGPSTGRGFFDDGKSALDFDRGPWTTAEQYKSAIGHRENTCIQNIPQLPRSPIALYGPGTYKPTRAKKIIALKNYLQILKYLLPTDPSISLPSLFHPDLHTENIFQSTEVLPLFDQARQPYILDYDGPEPTGLDRPKLPDHYSELNPAEKHETYTLYLNLSLATLYRKYTSLKTPRFFQGMEFRNTTSFDMMLLVQNLLTGGEAIYHSQILDIREERSNLPGVQAAGNLPFPVQISLEEAKAIEEDPEGAAEAMEIMRELRESLGDFWPENGVVRADQYEEFKRLLGDAKIELINRLAGYEDKRGAWEEVWPFDD
ncbi:kinase-like domain-containing protein [Aspergillus crustosus]